MSTLPFPGGRPDGTPSSKLLVCSVGSLFAGRFRVLALLGCGASSIVYKVLDETSRVEVALKVYNPALHGETNRERIRREVELSWKLGHTNLVRVFDWGQEEGIFYLIMEFCPGGTLRQQAPQGEGVTPSQVEVWARQALAALAALHADGVVHRDVKPDNCFLTADGTFKLGDLGLVKADSWASLTETGASLGTPRYMAPEVIKGQPATPISDLYSLGITIFELLTGVAPFAGTSALEVASKHLGEPPPLYLLRKRGVPRSLRAVVARLLEKDPADRYPSAETVIRALDRGPGLPAIPRRWRRRLAIAVMVLLAAAGVFFLRRHLQREAPLIPSFQGKVLEVRDAAGALLWRKTLPRIIQSVHYGRFGPDGAPAVACSITWGERLTVERPELEFDQATNRILIFNRSGTMIKNVKPSLPFNQYSPRFVVRLESHEFCPGEGERLVASVRHTLWYPYALNVFDTTRRSWWNGQMEGAIIYNSGYMESWLYQDINRDGREEVVFTCVNNRIYHFFFAGAAALPDVSYPQMTLSPDNHLGDVHTAPLFYRGSAAIGQIRLAPCTDGPSASFFVLLNGAPIFELTRDGQLRRTGHLLAPSAAELSRINGLIGDLCALRDQGAFQKLLQRCAVWPAAPLEPYGWIGRFFLADALKGLGRYAEIPAVLDQGLPAGVGDKPNDYYQFLMDSAFLAGDFQECLRRFHTMPAIVWSRKAEIGLTALWAAAYAGVPDLNERYLHHPSFRIFDWYKAMFPGVLACLEGDFATAESLLRQAWTLPAAEEPDPAPGLWLVEALIRRDKLREARSVVGPLARQFVDNQAGIEETELWLRWHEGEKNTGLVARMDGVVARRRQTARTDVETFALLPLTLSRAARMHRDLGHTRQAAALLREVLRMVPAKWRRGLAL